MTIGWIDIEKYDDRIDPKKVFVTSAISLQDGRIPQHATIYIAFKTESGWFTTCPNGELRICSPSKYYPDLVYSNFKNLLQPCVNGKFYTDDEIEKIKETAYNNGFGHGLY